MLRTLGKVLREANFDVTAVVCDELLIDLEPGDTTTRRFAMAFDLGTTTVVATLLDLETGQPAAVQSMLNRQQPFGADVISRVSATMLDEGALDALQARAQETLAQLTQEVCAEAGVDPGEVYEITICGNVTMTQLALGMDPEPLSMAPFIVTTHEFPQLLAADLGVPVHARAPAFVFPSLGAYVGGDIVAGMLATGLTRDKRIRLFIDVGTNSEIALGNQDGVVATAAPAGPAFEAAQIRCGMRAAEGAIEGVALADDLTLEVIGDTDPIGVCGSGLVDAVAELVRVGLLDHSGRFVTDEEAAEISASLAPRLTKIGDERVFVLSWKGDDPAASVYLTQRDIRELQFAKASIATGWRILFGELGMEPEDVSQVLLAGSFGQYLSPAAAVRIGWCRASRCPGSCRRERGARARRSGRPVPARARRGALDPERGALRGALRPRRLQRRVHRRAGVPGSAARPSSPAARSRPQSAAGTPARLVNRCGPLRLFPGNPP